MIILTENKDIELIEELYRVNGGELENINEFGIRNPAKKSLSVWNDVIGMYDRSEKMIFLKEATTDPSRWWTLNHRKGVDNLTEGFHNHIWALGKHRGKLAFVQGPRKITTIRDTNRNFEIDPGDEIVSDEAWWGIDHHTTYRPVKTLGIIGKASAGCQVDKHWIEFEHTRDIAKASGQPLYSYLLMALKAENKYFYNLVYGE